MVTYDFYTDTYQGSALSQGEFSRLAAPSEQWLEKLKQTCQVTAWGQDSYALAVCAVAEAMGSFHTGQRVSAATVGNVSVRYEQSDSLEKKLLAAAKVYLDVYRGVG